MSSNSILLITHELTYTGAPRSLCNLAKCLLEEGHDVTVWSLETGDFFAEFTALGLDVVYVTKEEFKSERVKKAVAAFDLVIASTVFCGEIAADIQKYVKTLLYLGEARNIGKIINDFSMDKEKIASVKNIACVSSYAKKSLGKFLGRDDIKIIHNYTEDYNHKGEMYKVNDKKLRFIVSGTVEQRKGQDLVIKAYNELPQGLKKRASLYVVGKAPEWSKKYFSSLKFGEGIHFRNEIKDRVELLEYYKRMDVFIVSSRDEACSMVALEAAMLGKGVIVSSHVGAGYICNKQYHFKSGDASSLCQKMEEFINDTGAVSEAGRENRQNYLKYAVKQNTKDELNACLKALGIATNQVRLNVKAKDKKNLNSGVAIRKLKSQIEIADKNTETGGRRVIPVVFATDTNYAPFAAAVIKSIYASRNKNNFYNIYILYDDSLTHSMYEALQQLNTEGMSVRLINVSSCVSEEKLYLSGHYSMQMYYRWLIPELFGSYDKVLYLDCDLAVQGDVAELFDIDIGDNYLGMVRNTVRTSFKSYVEETLGLSVDEYHNSGVILFNTKQFVKDDIKGKCVSFISRDRDLLCPDQDAINVCCKGKIYTLPDEWNFQWHHLIPGVEDGGFTSDYKKRYETVLENGPKIIHYTSYKKPWNEPKLKLADVFWKYFRQIPKFDDVMRKFAYGKKGLKRSTVRNAAGHIEDSVHYKERIDFLQHSLEETRNSFTYKIGRAITAVPRRVRHALTGSPV